MLDEMSVEILVALTSGWTGFFFYWTVFMLVATAEQLRPSRRDRAASADRITVNFGLGFFVAAFQMLPFLSSYAGALFAESQNWGALRWMDMPFWASMLIGFLLLDLAGYAFHRASHEIPLLWRVHRVHHSDPMVDASTTFRSHPLATMLFAGYELTIISALGIEPMSVLLYLLCKMLVAWASHADIAPSPALSRWIAKLVVTPAFHHWHHSANQAETDSNYGEVLTLWDRLFGSASYDAGAVPRYGLGDSYDADAVRLTKQLQLPFASVKSNMDGVPEI